MIHDGYLASTLVLGALTVGLVAAVTRCREWRSYTPEIADVGHEGRRLASALRLSVVGPVRPVPLLTLAYVVLVLGVVGLTVGSVHGTIDHGVLVAGLGAVVAGFFAYGIVFSTGIPRLFGRLGYRIKRTVSFRGRPVWSLLMGWATFGTVLLVITVILVGLWLALGNAIAVLVVLGLGGLVVVRYATSLAGVRLLPTTGGGLGSLPSGRRRSPPDSPGRHRIGLQFPVDRALPVLRGWVAIAGVLVLGATATAALWIAGGTVGLLGGLGLAGVLATAYGVTHTWE